MTVRLFVLGSYITACCATVERLPLGGECLIATTFAAEPGGKGFNMAVGCRRLGAEVDCLVAVGGDFFGGLAASALVEADLPLDLLMTIEGAETGAGIGFIAPDGETSVAVCPGANLAVSASDVHAHADTVRAAAVTLASFETADAAIVAAFALARASGRRTLLNASPFRSLTPAILEASSIVVVNRSEGYALAKWCGVNDFVADPAGVDALAGVLSISGVEILIVTLGADGAIAASAQQILVQPACQVMAIDALGAGDAFVAGLITALARGETLVDALRRGAASGALMTTRAGTFRAFPSAREVDNLLAIEGVWQRVSQIYYPKV